MAKPYEPCWTRTAKSGAKYVTCKGGQGKKKAPAKKAPAKKAPTLKQMKADVKKKYPTVSDATVTRFAKENLASMGVKVINKKPSALAKEKAKMRKKYPTVSEATIARYARENLNKK